MWNEHFGIGIVEMMAAGLIVIAHNSGGPKSDIVVPLNRQKKSQGESSSFSTTSFSDTTGFLASSADEYAAMMHRALALSPTEASAIRKNAQESAKRFTDEVFAESFERSIMDLLWSC